MSFDFQKAVGLGTTNIDRGILGMPFLNMIQKGSPEFDATHPKYADKKIPGCTPGDILFEPERAVIKQPLIVIPLEHTMLYTEWRPKNSGGGFIGNRSLDIVAHPDYRKGKPGTPDEYKEWLGQNELVYTIYFIVLFNHNGTWKQGMMAFTATQLKYARGWLQKILGTKLPGLDGPAPIFASTYKLTTFADGNKKGGFFSWRIEQGDLLDATKDQALLEHAFDETKKAQARLPRPAPVAQIADAVAGAVPEGDSPY